MKPHHAIIALVGCATMACFVFIIAELLSPAARWNFGLWLGQNDHDYITGLRDNFVQNPTNQIILDKIIARTKSPNSFKRVNAIAVLTQLSYYNTATGRKIHSQALPVFVRALGEEDQGIKLAALDGLENLGPYAVSSIPDIKKEVNDPDPIIQKEAQKVLVELENFQTNISDTAPLPN